MPEWVQGRLAMNSIKTRKAIRDMVADPLRYDALLAAFESSAALAASASDEAAMDDLAQDAMPDVMGGAQKDSALDALQGAVDTYLQPCLLVTDVGLVVALNRPAHTAFDLEVSDQIDDCGLELQDNGALSERVLDILDAKKDGYQTTFCRAYFKDAERPILLAIVPHSGDSRAAFVFLVDIGWDEAIAKFISRAYDLTQTEQDVLEQFILGNSLDKIAESRSRSVQTVRTQFYSALNKCGLSSQVDLVREVVAGSMFQSFVPKVADAAKHPHRSEFRMPRPGGRILEVVASGDFSGKPIFTLASFGGQKFSPNRTRKFKDAGFCLYAISPPGFGYTTLEPDGEDHMDCLADDIVFMMDQLKLSGVPFMTFGPSLLPTVRLTRKLPGRISHIQSWLTMPPTRFHEKRGAEKTLNAISAMGNAAAVSPKFRDLVVRSSLRAWAVLGTRKMAKIQSRSEPEITQHLLEPETINAIDEGFRSAIRQGFTPTVVRHAEESHSDWFADAVDCTAPVTIVHGENDKTNSMQSVRDFVQAAGKNYVLKEVRKAGGFLHVTHEDLFVASLKELAEG